MNKDNIFTSPSEEGTPISPEDLTVNKPTTEHAERRSYETSSRSEGHVLIRRLVREMLRKA